MLKHLLTTAAFFAAVTGASAATLTSTAGAPDQPIAGQSVIVDFDSVTPGVSYSGSYSIDALSISGQRAAPAGDKTAYFGVPGTDDVSANSATIDFTGYLASHAAFKALSFYWGSIDGYNTLELLGSGLTGQTVFTGADIKLPANGDQGSQLTNRRVNFAFTAGETLTGLKLTSTGRAFEIDDIATNAVPEPAMWAMMIVGFGLVGASMRNRTRALAA